MFLLQCNLFLENPLQYDLFLEGKNDIVAM